jgi:Fe2+ transport system protein B
VQLAIVRAHLATDDGEAVYRTMNRFMDMLQAREQGITAEAAERLFAPVVQGWLGLPARATEAFLVGFLRRDYGAAGLYRLQQEGLLNLRQVTVSLVLITLFMPCIAQWLMMFKERGWRAALGLTLAVMAVALGVSGALNGLLLAFPSLVG